MTDTNEAVGAQALEPVQVAADKVEATEPKENPEAAVAHDAGGEGAKADPSATGTDSNDGDKPGKKGGFQRKIEKQAEEINKIAVERHKERLEREALARENEELRKKLSPPASTEPNAEPKLEDFNTVDDFVKAHKDWAVQEGKRAAQQEIEQKSEHEKVIMTKATMAAREEAARARFKDFDQVVNPYAPALMKNAVTRQFMIESDIHADVAYELAKNPVKLAEVMEMPPLAAVRELLKIEARLKAPPPPKPVTKAPDPIKPVGQSEKAPFSYESASMEEYARKRAEERRKRKG